MSISTPADRLEPVLTWIERHRDAALADLQRFCRQPSISAQGQGMREMARIVTESLRDLGAETSLVPTQGFPVVVGRLVGVSTRRLAIYDHYDVQPPEPVEFWSMPHLSRQPSRMVVCMLVGWPITKATWLRVCGPFGPGARCMERCHVG